MSINKVRKFIFEQSSSLLQLVKRDDWNLSIEYARFSLCIPCPDLLEIMRILLVDVYGNEKIKKVKNVFGIYFVLYIILYYHERLKDSHKHEEKRLQSLNR